VHRLEDTRRQLRAVEEQLGAKAKEAEDLARARNRDKVGRDLTGWLVVGRWSLEVEAAAQGWMPEVCIRGREGPVYG
jgi:hypothetical protein